MPKSLSLFRYSRLGLTSQAEDPDQDAS